MVYTASHFVPLKNRSKYAVFLLLLLLSKMRIFLLSLHEGFTSNGESAVSTNGIDSIATLLT